METTTYVTAERIAAIRVDTTGTILPSAFCLLPFAFCLLPSAFCLLPFAFCLLRVFPSEAAARTPGAESHPSDWSRSSPTGAGSCMARFQIRGHDWETGSD